MFKTTYTFQVAVLQDRIKALEDDSKMLNHSLSDKNAQIKLHSNQMNVRVLTTT